MDNCCEMLFLRAESRMNNISLSGEHLFMGAPVFITMLLAGMDHSRSVGGISITDKECPYSCTRYS